MIERRSGRNVTDTETAGILSRKALHPWSLNSGFARALALYWIELNVEVTVTVVSAGFKLDAVAGLVRALTSSAPF